MSASPIKDDIQAAMKAAMRAKEKARLQTIRLIQSEFKRVEVDERIELDDNRVLTILDKMLKQRRDSAQQYSDAGRDELAQQEQFEISVIQEFLPEQLSEEEIATLIDAAIADVDGSGMQAMGPVMGKLKPQLQGKADMGAVSALIKARLQG
ncbi:MAG: GatB/YqeY domain-containing protein [Pseudomonadota bacterium]